MPSEAEAGSGAGTPEAGSGARGTWASSCPQNNHCPPSFSHEVRLPETTHLLPGEKAGLCHSGQSQLPGLLQTRGGSVGDTASVSGGEVQLPGKWPALHQQLALPRPPRTPVANPDVAAQGGHRELERTPPLSGPGSRPLPGSLLRVPAHKPSPASTSLAGPTPRQLLVSGTPKPFLLQEGGCP